ncbi:MAG: lytic murein transglycosylase [bacterium]
MNKAVKTGILFLILTALILPSFSFFVSGQESNLNVSEERAKLEAELKELEIKISQYENDITKTQKEKQTLQTYISGLKSKISKLDLQVRQSNIMIADLGLQVTDTENSIEKTSLKIDDSGAKLASTLRLIYEEDQHSLLEILFSEASLSDFFDNLVSLEALSAKSQELLKDIKTLKIDLESQKDSLDSEKEELERVTKMQMFQIQENKNTKSEQEQLLALTKGKETEYQKLLQITKEKAAQIRARIFELIGVPEAPTFGEAVDLANYVESVTGIRPAFLLAVITQESNMGKNVGQCYLKNTQTGAGVIARTGKAVNKVMKPGASIDYFLELTKKLNRDPFQTLVSCPMSYGWGGAMGPAQFIPSTWRIYEDRVAAITGSADPWKIKDAFVASALYLKDKGADSQTYNAEWRAAIAYFSGSVNLRYSFYGDSVMSIAKRYESDIAAIENNK